MTSRTKNRELLNLSLVLIITIILTLFSLSIDFIDRIHKYLSVYSTLPISELLIKVLFIWLVLTLWVTYRRWREAETRQRELEDIISSINADILVVVDRDRNIIMCNASVKRVFGYEVNEVINRKIDLLYYDINSDASNSNKIADTLTRDGFSVGLATGKKKNGDTIPLEIITGNRSDQNGAVLLLRDITERKRVEEALLKAHEGMEQQVKNRTAELVKANEQLKLQIVERKQAEEALKRSEERYHDLIEFANAGIITVENEKIIQVNRKAEEFYGYLRDELIGQSPRILTPEQYWKNHSEVLNEYLRSGNVGKMLFEEEGTQKDGSLFPIEISFSLSERGENSITIIAVMRDITERKKMEEKFIQSEKLSALGELAGGVAHDFNNMLAAILGRVQLLRMHNSPLPGVREKRKSVRELQKGLEIIEKAAMDGAETVRRIQEFSRRSPDDKDFTQVDINELINNALEFTRMRWKDKAESKGIKIVIKKEFSSIPPTIGSGAELREVFTNLLNNALDAMPHGGRITFKTFKEDNYICVAVKDTGSGIPKAVREKIFDPFFTTRGPQSTGLGLSVSYGIISRHRGAITVDSIEGEGTTFTIKLPILAKAIKEEKIEFKPVQKRKARILVIDDEEGVRNVLNDILTDAGHEVEIAGDGIQGIELFERKEFDLVFTDLGMPVVSGWQVAERIKGINRKVPIALITGWNVDLKESEMTSSCIDLIIKKPFAVDQVLRLVQEGMELRERFKAA